ncbi:hypothetical protein Sste5346_005776 [Sporothrix stenoceras]|uniref:Armadillo repeat-containing protein 8 n=1 Tax=Sporothrix stenoceras TaxID=5173 RepID=A0ABR3Z1R8_9PEZI
MVLLSQNVAILENLRTAQSYTAQTQALQALKNETVGHVMKKEKWVELGVLLPIVKVILPERPSNWLAGDGREADDLARLQALELLGIFASGGAAFLEPLHAAGALPAILSCIDPKTSHRRLVYAALRSIVTITKAARLISVPASSPSPVTLGTLADTIFNPTHLKAFYNIIVAAPRAWWNESITNAAVSLVSPLCRETHHQVALAKAGILDALAVKVASYVVAKGQVVPGADIAAEKEGLLDYIPEPATSRLDISAVLDAAAAIMGNSRLRACMLLCSPSILAIFPQLEFDSPMNDVHAAWKALSMGGLSNLNQQSLGALDFLLPAIPSQALRGHHHSSHNSPFPPLGSTFARESLSRQFPSSTSGAAKRGSGSRHPSSGEGSGAGAGPEGLALDSEEQESPMVPWLFSLVRSTSGLERLMAASVLTSLYKAGFANKTREAAMAYLVVPLLLRMLGEAVNSASGDGSGGWVGDDDSNKTEHQAITEAALTILARLVTNSDVLQKAAIDGKAIKILAKLLKESYEPVSTRSNPRPWNPTPTASANPSRTGTPVAGTQSQSVGGEWFVEDNETAAGGDADNWAMQIASSKLGPAGQSSQLAYRTRLREATLKALTALVAVKYDYQREFADLDAMVYVSASLNATPSKPRANKDRTRSIKDVEMNTNGNSDDDVDPEYGRNPVGVLVAACDCVRMLSRSIAILRTTLEDAGVAAPIFRLLRHPDVYVQIAATGVICNLLTETSPMRERFAEAGVMSILCTHAHSLNSALRVNALWALKHFVDGQEPGMKKACLEQLGSGWLMQLIDPDSEVDASPSSAIFTGRADNSYNQAGGMAAAVATPSWSFTTVANDEDVEMGQTGDDGDGGAGDYSSNNNEAGGGEDEALWTATATTNPPPAAGVGLGSPSFQRARFPRTSHERSRTGRLRQADDKLAALQEMEIASQRKKQNDEVMTQEQGLNFIRNLIGPGSSSNGTNSSLGLGQPTSAAPRDAISEASEMIDYLFNEIGQDRLFQILLSKLRPKVRPATASRVAVPAVRRRSIAGSSGSGANAGPSTSAAVPGSPSSEAASSSGSRVQQPKAKIVEAVVFILVHISASVSRHRQIVIAQTELLKALVSHFMNRDKAVRVALCHLVNNLAWRDDQADIQMANTRIIEIRRLGLLQQLEIMQFEDPELDVREQAKMAVHQMELTAA